MDLQGPDKVRREEDGPVPLVPIRSFAHSPGISEPNRWLSVWSSVAGGGDSNKAE